MKHRTIIWEVFTHSQNRRLKHSIISNYTSAISTTKTFLPQQNRKAKSMHPILAYVDPSVMTYTIQAIAGAVIALGAVIGVTWRVMKKKTQKVLKIDENSKKEMEEDVQIIDDKWYADGILDSLIETYPKYWNIQKNYLWCWWTSKREDQDRRRPYALPRQIRTAVRRTLNHEILRQAYTINLSWLLMNSCDMSLRSFFFITITNARIPALVVAW